MNENVKSGIYTYNDIDTTFNFRTSLSAYDKVKFVNSVTNLLVGDNYNYVIKNIVFAFYIIDIFTDIDTTDITDSSDVVNAIEDFVYNTNIVDIVMENAEAGLIDDLRKAVDINIEYRTGIHLNPISDSISSLLNTIEKKFDEIDINSLMGFAQSISGISGELTADKMLDAFAKTDIYKKNWSASDSDDDKNVKKSKKSKVDKSGFEVVDDIITATHLSTASE